MGGTDCTSDTSCRVFDTTSNPRNTGTFTVVSPGTVTVRRNLQGSSPTTIGTLTIVDGATPTPDPTPSATVSVTDVSPATGLSTGGTPVTITGTGFAGGTTPTVRFGGTAATDVTVSSDTSLTATSPAHDAGAVDVSVLHDGVTGTKSDAFTYAPVYWLTLANTQPVSHDGLDSLGALQTPDFGKWASVDVRNHAAALGGEILTSYSGYGGGIYCGNSSDTKEGQFRLISTWTGGPCRYPFAAGTSVTVAAQPSSDVYADPLVKLVGRVEERLGFVGAWGDDCIGASGPACTVSMTADRTVGAAWGYAHWQMSRTNGEVTVPIYGLDGVLRYFSVTVSFESRPKVNGGIPQYFLLAIVPVATAHEQAGPTGGRVVCRSAARLTGKSLTARCRVSPVLAAALARGRVRLVTKWEVKLPNQGRTLLRRGTVTISNRRANAITG